MNQEDDLLERLKKPLAWARVYGGTVTADDAPFLAAIEIERLRRIISDSSGVRALEGE